MSSRSSENLHILDDEVDFHTSSPVRRRLARRSFRKKSPSPGNKSRSHSTENCNRHDEAVREAEKLLKHNEPEVKKRLEALSCQNGLVKFRLSRSPKFDTILTLFDTVSILRILTCFLTL